MTLRSEALIVGSALSGLAFRATSGNTIDLGDEEIGPFVLFIYPRTGRPGDPDAEEWAQIPGAKGCTAESCEFRDLNADFGSAGYRLFGLSSQTSEDQSEAASRLHLPYDLLSDHDLILAGVLGLETFNFKGATLYKRVTLVVVNGNIVHVEENIASPSDHPRALLDNLRIAADRSD